MIRLSDQYFTDRKEIAQGYAKNENGVLIEINPQIEEILKYFKVEFQDFGKRKDDFQLVYRVKGKDLCENKDRWGLKVKKFSKNDRISLNQELAP